jgi:hypothetical protein
MASSMLLFGVYYYRGKKQDWEDEKQKLQIEVNLNILAQF